VAGSLALREEREEAVHHFHGRRHVLSSDRFRGVVAYTLFAPHEEHRHVGERGHLRRVVARAARQPVHGEPRVLDGLPEQRAEIWVNGHRGGLLTHLPAVLAPAGGGYLCGPAF